MIVWSFVMNFLLVVIFCIIHGGSEVVADDNVVEDMTAPEDLMPKKDLDEFNQIRKDLLKSFVDLRSQMETEESKKQMDYCIHEVKGQLELDRYNVSNKEDLEDNVNSLDVAIEMVFDKGVSRGFKMETDSEQKKFEDFFKEVPSEYNKRFEPFKKYETNEKKD